MTLRPLPLLVILIILLAAAPTIAEDPTRLPPGATASDDLPSLRARAESYPVHATDGSVRHSTRRPLVAFGRLRISDERGHAAWIDLEEVDLERSRDLWNVIDTWAALDTHPLQGRRLPELDLPDDVADAIDVPDGENPVLFWPWRSY